MKKKFFFLEKPIQKTTQHIKTFIIMASFAEETKQQQQQPMRRKNKLVHDERHLPSLDMCIVEDQSGSISESAFATIVNFCRDLVRRMQRQHELHSPAAAAPCNPASTSSSAPDPAEDAQGSLMNLFTAQLPPDESAPRYSVVGFAAGVSVQCQPTSDVSVVMDAIGKRTAVDTADALGVAFGYSTNTTDALGVARELLTTNGRHDAKKLLVLVSDGCPNNQAKAEEAANACKDSNILVIAVTVGMSDVTNMRALVSSPMNKNLIQAESFASLPNVLNDLLSAVGSGHITLEPLPLLTAGIFESSEPTLIRLKIKNSTSVPTSSGLRVRLCGSHQIAESAFVPVPLIQAGDFGFVHLPHEWIIDDILETNSLFEYELFDGTTPVVKSSWELSFADFNGGLHDVRLPESTYSTPIGNEEPTLFTPERHNILFVGWQGSGKSTTVNLCATLLNPTSDKVLTHEAKTIGRMEHATTALEMHDLSDVVRIVDIPGLEEDTYKKLELAQICTGLLEEDRELLATTIDDDNADLLDADQRERRHVDQIHAVVVFFLIETLENEESCNIVLKHLKTLEALGYNPVVMLAKTDDVEPGIRQDPLHFDRFEELVRAKERVSSLTGYPKNNILHTLSYLEETRRTWKLDVLAYHNMKTWMSAASQRMDKLHKKGGRAKKKWDRKVAILKEATIREQMLAEERSAVEAEKEEMQETQPFAEQQRRMRLAALLKESVTGWLTRNRLVKYSKFFEDEEFEQIGDLLSLTDENLCVLCTNAKMKTGSLLRFQKNIAIARALQNGEELEVACKMAATPNPQSEPRARVEVVNGGLVAALGSSVFNRFSSNK